VPSPLKNWPSFEQLSVGVLIVTRHNPKVPVHVTAVDPWPGASAGFLVSHDGAGVPTLDGADVRLWRSK
jgi:hypothetical protein